MKAASRARPSSEVRRLQLGRPSLWDDHTYP
jgi:hypothetical protein